ncbi:hypothetical protein M409DRAFT_71333 [Zasmidium cellare ATCC 36951]|uniref:FAD-binding domain-containing protein n=1 Tax=Zasmidium cellare ATCC 36951 TaxID=1080233 RepID=A0A6A6BWC1_ZASCE|nr:uncharacterized protein M409DRAFT_71333 [Zasmidium cellare ATCC 36951]KAF2158985.1 hypothetical protein M409DRAFT_71333 [Zasmidium cellare ATCC 36951]
MDSMDESSTSVPPKPFAPAVEATVDVGDPNKIIIIGAGPTGLALAQGLKKASIPYVVYERNENENIKRNWSMGVHWAIPCLKELLPEEVFATIERTQVDPHRSTSDTDRLTLLNGATGELIKSVDSSKFYRLRRDKFRKMLLTGLEIRWGKTLDQITYSDDGLAATTHFADGTRDTGSIIVGTDGPHSRVRTLLVGEEKAKVEPTDFATTMCFTKHTREHALFLRAPPHHPLYQTAAHPMGMFSWLSLHDGEDPDHPEDWTFYHYVSFKEPRDYENKMTNAELVARQKELAKHFVDPWKSVFEWMPDDHPVWYGKLRHWDPRDPGHQWDNQAGRVTIAGDAAHPMTFQRGQGLNHALKDSLELCKAVQKYWNDGAVSVQDRKEALDAYEEEMIQRGGEEVRLSEGNSKTMHNFEKVMESATVKAGMHLTRQGIAS